jgi:two-component system alkaline phosphatase synthesis response regulator PhoP
MPMPATQFATIARHTPEWGIVAQADRAYRPTLQPRSARPSGRVLVVEDDRRVRSLIVGFLEGAGFTVVAVPTLARARHRLRQGGYELALVDLTLSDGHGLELVEELRDRAEVSVIVVSGRAGERDRVAGLSAGADDYLVKPFAPRELVARVQAVLRRTREPSLATVYVGDLEIDRTSRTLRRNGSLVGLAEDERDVFFALASRSAHWLSWEALVAAVSERSARPSFDRLSKAGVAGVIRRLRRKIDRDPSHPGVIVTVRGLGYRLTPAITVNREAS